MDSSNLELFSTRDGPHVRSIDVPPAHLTAELAGAAAQVRQQLGLGRPQPDSRQPREVGMLGARPAPYMRLLDERRCNLLLAGRRVVAFEHPSAAFGLPAAGDGFHCGTILHVRAGSAAPFGTDPAAWQMPWHILVLFPTAPVTYEHYPIFASDGPNFSPRSPVVLVPGAAQGHQELLQELDKVKVRGYFGLWWLSSLLEPFSHHHLLLQEHLVTPQHQETLKPGSPIRSKDIAQEEEEFQDDGDWWVDDTRTPATPASPPPASPPPAVAVAVAVAVPRPASYSPGNRCIVAPSPAVAHPASPIVALPPNSVVFLPFSPAVAPPPQSPIVVLPPSPVVVLPPSPVVAPPPQSPVVVLPPSPVVAPPSSPAVPLSSPAVPQPAVRVRPPSRRLHGLSPSKSVRFSVRNKKTKM